MAELSNYIITKTSISIQETVGQGLTNHICVIAFILCIGEFGIVYRAVMTVGKGPPQPVAAKTLKGTSTMFCAIFCSSDFLTSQSLTLIMAKSEKECVG